MKGSDQQNIMFVPKAARSGELKVLGSLIAGGKGNVPQVLKGIGERVRP